MTGRKNSTTVQRTEAHHQLNVRPTHKLRDGTDLALVPVGDMLPEASPWAVVEEVAGAWPTLVSSARPPRALPAQVGPV